MGFGLTYMKASRLSTMQKVWTNICNISSLRPLANACAKNSVLYTRFRIGNHICIICWGLAAMERCVSKKPQKSIFFCFLFKGLSSILASSWLRGEGWHPADTILDGVVNWRQHTPQRPLRFIKPVNTDISKGLFITKYKGDHLWGGATLQLSRNSKITKT